MNLALTRKEFKKTGVYGELRDEHDALIAVTLEHVYQVNGLWTPKVAPGTYNCVRHAPNKLPYETFMLENVPDFQGKPVSGILLHCGNYNKDSEGCILVGLSVVSDMIAHSRAAFATLMHLQQGLDHFKLTINNS